MIDPYQPTKDAIKVAKEKLERHSLRKLKKRCENVEKARENRLLYKFLKWKYGNENLLEIGEEIYPVAVYLPSDSQRDLESVLKKPLLRNCPKYDDFVAWDVEYRALRERVRKLENLEWLGNRLTYTMASLDIKKLQFTCQLGYYYYALDTCDCLEWELLSNISKLKDNNKRSFEAFDEKLKLRKALHERVENPVIDGKGRSAAIAISTLIAFSDNGRLQLWWKLRSEDGVDVHPRLWHVIPSFMFQPITGSLDEEFSVKHNICREYLEEVFRRPKCTKDGKKVYGEKCLENREWNYIHNEDESDENTWPLRYLRKLMGSLVGPKEAELLFTGVVINLLNLRPEICTLLLIRTPQWYKDNLSKFEINEEFTPLNKIRPKDRPEELVGRIPYLQTYTDTDYLRENKCLSPSCTVPPGAVAFWLGLHALRDIL